MLKQMFDQVREKSPLIHNITNYVTVNDCANMVLACGASPIMADDKEEVAEIQTILSGCVMAAISSIHWRTASFFVRALAASIHFRAVLLSDFVISFLSSSAYPRGK